MGLFILAVILMIAFVAYRIYAYKKQRRIEEMAADAQAYVSSELVEVLQGIKNLVAANGGQITPDLQKLQDQIRHQTENLTCHTDSEASVKEYLSATKQDLAILKVKLQKVKEGQTPEITTTPVVSTIDDEFDALK